MNLPPRISPISMKIKAVKNELNELDAEINSITQELDTYDDIEPAPIENKPNPNPIKSNSLKFRATQIPISHRTPEFNKNYSNKLQSKKISQTPDFNANSTLHIEDLVSFDDEDETSTLNSKTLSTPRKISFRKNQSSYDNKSQFSHKSIQQSPNSQSNNSSFNTEILCSPRQVDDESNRLYTQSVKIIEKRTHSKFNDPWFQIDDYKNYNEDNYENDGFTSQETEIKNDELYFPKQSSFSYNYTSKSKYKPITEMERINETKIKREKMAFLHQKEKEKEMKEECTFKPILSTRVPIISAEEEEKIRIKKQQKYEENISQSNSKAIRFIDPNSEKIANKAKTRKSPKKQIQYEDQNSPSPKVKYLTRKQIQKSCERLSKPKYPDNETDPIVEEEEEQNEPTKKARKKYANPEAIERLFQNSTKPRQNNKNSDFDENDNQDNINGQFQGQKPPHSFMDSKSREIIEKTAKYRNSNDLFEDSIQVAEEKFRQSRETQKYKEMQDSNYSYRPKINQTPPHFTVNTTDYSSLTNGQYYSGSNSPKAKRIYYEAKYSQLDQNQSSPLRKSYIVSPSPKKKKQKYQASEYEIRQILDEVDAKVNSLSNV